ncbi:TadE/TadG family type IV pilus assembly protein [Phyllobacterium lublinensis]|jgi:Flp pilus assembly protein TadG|uniref:TadE/TadG family type IV pilus assembly protein n=1 Tax=Phyllobacterium lublinensis TaxID=2875708 RepID=UPI001CCA0832|nr:TadE/TadG family type IV pilus assembly protein [Phyllobacterium sp. 2063]MBZ9656702.1 pilus assembly protein [Phyllobacterium sp. 2063]
MKANNKQTMAAGRLATLAKRFIRDKRGIAAMEFAFIAPILIVLYLGSVEATSGLDVNKKLGRATNMVADLVTQQQTITTDQLKDIMEIGTALLLPYRFDTPQITITAINIPATGSPTVAWSRKVVNKVYSRPYAAGSTVTLDPNLVIPNTTVIRVETKIAYLPLMAFKYSDAVTTASGVSAVGIPMGRTGFGRVRQGAAVACSNC